MLIRGPYHGLCACEAGEGRQGAQGGNNWVYPQNRNNKAVNQAGNHPGDNPRRYRYYHTVGRQKAD